VNAPGLLTSKAVVGILLAFTQAIILMILTDSLRSEPFLLALALLFGALVVTGLAFLIASASRGMMSVMAWSILVIIIMLIPAYGVVFPGAITQRAQIIPSYYMFDTIHQVVNFGASWDAVSSNLLILLAAGLIFMGAGMWVLERKMR
jgi:ABC-type multidrug transport system permease subunit